MPIIKCNAQFDLGREEIDRYNNRLIDSLNAAFDEFAESGQMKELESLLQELTEHARRNFACEESLLQETGYPDLLQHKKEHELFAATVLKMKGDRRPNAALTVDTLWFLVTWVTHHVRGSDVESGRHLKASAAARQQ